MKKYLFISIYLFVASAEASLISYTDRSTWESAVGSFSTEDFNSESTLNFNLGANSVGPFDFNIAGTQVFGGVRTGNEDDNIDGTTFVLGAETQVNSMTMHFSSPISAFFADFENVNGGSGLNITVDSTLFNLPAIFGGQDGSFGVTSTTPFSSIEFGSVNEHLGNEVFGIDNVSFQTSAVPVPAAVWLFGSGLIGLIGMRKKTSKVSVL